VSGFSRTVTVRLKADTTYRALPYTEPIVRMPRSVAVAICASLLLNVVLLLIGRGSFGHWFLALVLATWIAGYALLLAGGLYVIGYWAPRIRRGARIVAIIALVCVSGVISLAPGHWVVEHDIDAAKRYCDALIIQIDDYKRAHGAYPADVSVLHPDPNVPLLLRADWSTMYRPYGSWFSIDFTDPRGIMNWIGYSSTTREWRTWH